MGDIGPDIVFDPGPSAGGFPTFAPDGTLLGNITGNFGQPPSANIIKGSDLPAIGGSGTSIPQAASAAGITGGATPPSATTGSTAGNAANNWFVRAVIVILGFVFVAVGLSQFGVVQRLRP